MLTNSQKKNYKNNGYLIVKNLIDEKLIDNLLRELEAFKKTSKLFFSQSEHNWLKANKSLDKFKLLENSIFQFTDLIWAPKLSNAGRKILQSEKILEILQEISSSNVDFCMWQNMLFEKSTGTVDHLDSWYLDTNPMGSLVAGWFALEDITEKGGSFHVFPKSHQEASLEWVGMDHIDFLKWIVEKSSKYKKKSIFLSKGDALFWHPSLIHGSSLQKTEGCTRKSLTAHYFPINFLKGGKGVNESSNNIEYKKNVSNQIKEYRFFNNHIASNSTRRRIISSSIKGLVKHYFNVNNNPINLMNRKFYNFYK